MAWWVWDKRQGPSGDDIQAHANMRAAPGPLLCCYCSHRCVTLMVVHVCHFNMIVITQQSTDIIASLFLPTAPPPSSLLVPLLQVFS